MSTQDNRSRKVTPEEIEDDIARTQARIGHRAEELRDGLRPGNLLRELMPQDKSLAENLERVLEVARDKPLQSAVVGAGLVWLLASDGKRQSATQDRSDDYDPSAGKRVGQSIHALRRNATEAAETTREKASEYAESASEAGSRLKSKTVGGTRKAISDAPGRIADAASRGTSWVRDNPIPTGLMCLAAGAAVASVFAASKPDDDDEGGTNSDRNGHSNGAVRENSSVLADVNSTSSASDGDPDRSRTSSVLAEVNDQPRTDETG